MPRTQKPDAPQGQSYGERGEQVAAQKVIPLPRAANAGPPAPAQPPGSQQAPAMPPGGGGGQPVDAMQSAVQAARDFNPGITPLTAASQRPGEPVQAGLSMGPGGGPEIFDQPSRAMASADILTQMAQSTGDDRFMELAARIRGTGGNR